MNIKTNKQIPLLILLSLLTACSTQNSTTLGSESRLGGQSSPGGQNRLSTQSLPGSQLLNRQNKNCIDKKTGRAIPGCKLPTKTVVTTPAVRAVPATSGSMRKIVLKAPVKPVVASVVVKPVVVAPRSTFGVTTAAPRVTANTSFNTARPVTATLGTIPRRTNALVTSTLTKPFSTGIITNPVRSAVPLRPMPVVRPVVRVVPPKPQSTLRRLTLNGSANFKTGSSRLTNTGQTKLLALALSLQDNNTQITRLLIEGHTDSVGNPSMNQVLSLKRANSVAEYLASKGGFARPLMETVGLGESKPVASNKTRKGRAQNRRVEITATGTRRISR